MLSKNLFTKYTEVKNHTSIPFLSQHMNTVAMVPNTWHPTQNQNKRLALKALIICVFAEDAVKKRSWWKIYHLSVSYCD